MSGAHEAEVHADARSGAFARVAPVVTLVLVATFLLLDFANDIVKRGPTLHLTGMAIGTVLSVAGLVMLVRSLSESRVRARDLATALHRSRSDRIRFHRSWQALHGAGGLIDRKFSGWGLSAAEGEVGMLLLKGLSLKEIAAARGATETAVRQQAQAIYRKAGVTGRAELAALFLEELLQPASSRSLETPPPSLSDGAGR